MNTEREDQTEVFYNRHLREKVDVVLNVIREHHLCAVVAVQVQPYGPVVCSFLVPKDRSKIDKFLEVACIALAPVNSKKKIKVLKYLLKKLNRSSKRNEIINDYPSDDGGRRV